MEQFRGTTIVCVRRGNTVTMGGDGQVTLGNVVFKATARKVRRIYHDRILVGFAGATADAFTLVERFEGELEKHSGNLMRAAVELAKLWRTDRMLRHLEAMMIVADKDATLVLSGNGDVIEPEGGIAAIGSGGNYALSAARALKEHTEMDAPSIVIFFFYFMVTTATYVLTSMDLSSALSVKNISSFNKLSVCSLRT